MKPSMLGRNTFYGDCAWRLATPNGPNHCHFCAETTWGYSFEYYPLVI